MKKNLHKKRSLYRALHIFVMTMLIFNMSMMSFTFNVKDSFADVMSDECSLGETRDCTNGDGYAGSEECVDGHFDGNCDSDLYCGDGIVDSPEECDNGTANQPEGTMDPVWSMIEGDGDRDYCSDTCYMYSVDGTWCGDGVVQAGDEECDDGNNNDGDGCSASCEIETEETECVDDADCASGEFCDDGFCRPEDACSDVDNDNICDDIDTCIDIDGDGYGVGSDCLGSDCNPSTPGMQDRLCCYVDQDDDSYYHPYAYVSNDGEAKGEFCYCTDGDIHEICSDLTDETALGEDCNDNDATLTTDCSVPEDSNTATIKAYKVVCESEIYLPNWGQVDPLPSQIGSSTAADFVANTNAMYGREVCWLQADWQFQWGFGDIEGGSEGVDKTTGSWIGESSALADSTGMCGYPYCGPNTKTGTGFNEWKTFGPTDANGKSEVTINDFAGADSIWVREVLQDGYIPYTYPPAGPRENDISAELYCETDILNYDNYDNISNIEDGGVYHCIAFNAPKRVKINAFKVACESEIYLPNWGQVELMPGEPDRIQFDTAENYVNNINELNNRKVCWLEDNWQFQWGYNHKDGAPGVHKLPGDHVGEADGTSTAGQCGASYCGDNTYTGPEHKDWKTISGVTNENGMISLTLDEADLEGENGIWVREVLQDGYIPYTYPPDGPRENDISAELYCETDIVNYDNYDLIENPVASGIYNCIAFNAPKRVKINAFKVVCKDETYLPNWGQVELVPGEPDRIQFDTAANYVENINNLNEDEVCWLDEGWQFQWGYNHTGEGEGNGDGVHKLIGDLIGEANGVSTAGMCYEQYCGDNTYTGSAHNEWKTMTGHTNANGMVSVALEEDDLNNETGIWVREVLQDGYVPYTYPPDGPRENDISAELYCETDIVNYDNYDLIENPVASGIYNCIAFNAVDNSPRCGDGVCNGEEDCDICIDDCGECVDSFICGDGVCNGDEDCSNCESDCGSCTRSSSSGGGGLPLSISDEEITCVGEGSVEFSWRTNYKKTSRVIYGLSSTPSGVAPNYGYDYSSPENSVETLMHTVRLDGLTADIYYFKSISGVNRGREKTFDVSTCLPTSITAPQTDTNQLGGDESIIVKGEEGAPFLQINKVSDKELVNPGDEINFTITLTNAGNLTAFNVVLKDILPQGLTFSEFAGSENIWELGDLKPLESKEIKVKTIVDQGIVAGTYINTTEASADNYETVTASDDYVVAEVAVLAESGFSYNDLLVLLLALLSVYLGIASLKRKLAV